MKSIKFNKSIIINSYDRSQGVAYHNLPVRNEDESLKLYPMICSTTAKSTVKLINATSVRDNLQFQCMKVIGRYPELVKVSKINGCLMAEIHLAECFFDFLPHLYVK